MKYVNKKFTVLVFVIFILSPLYLSGNIFAIGSSQNPQSGPIGLEATIPSAPPSTAATISVPANGQTFSSLPINVSGLCQGNLLIKMFSNNIFVGSSVCSNGSYSLKIDLFNGRNDVYAQEYDSLGQGGPLSGTVTVNFNGGQSAQALSQITLTSSYAELGANPGQQLDWPIVISGGTPPYAISTDWGDGQPPTLQSSTLGGKVIIKHTYSTSGIYKVTVTVSDNSGSTSFLQLVGVANGQIVPKTKTISAVKTNSKNTFFNSPILLWLLGSILISLGPAFWLGSRHGRSVLLKKYK